MKAQFLERTLLALSLISLPAHVIAQSRCVPSQDHILFNRAVMPYGGATDLLELVRRNSGPMRLGLTAQSPDSQPYVIIDGVGVHGGLRRLADLRLNHVSSVTVLRPSEAASRFGPRAYRGAILVTTRSGTGCSVPPMDQR